MSEVKRITKFYGNGTNSIKDYNYNSIKANERKKQREHEAEIIRNGTGEFADYLRDKQRKQNRNYSCKKRVEDILMSEEFSYFCTLNASRYCRRPIELLIAANEFLDTQKVNYVVVLEAFYDGRRGYHLHVLTDKKIDLLKWINTYGGNISHGFSNCMN